MKTGDTGDERVDVAWTGPQIANAGMPRQRHERGRKVAPAAPLVVELLSRRQVVFDGRAGTTTSVPLPAIDTSAYGTWVLSVAVAEKAYFLAGNELKVWIQNVAVDPDNPAAVFVEGGPSVTIVSAPPAPYLVTAGASAPAGPQARLLLQWSQGGTAFNPKTVAWTVLSVWLTLRAPTEPIVT